MSHLAAGPTIDDVIVFAKRLMNIGWHLQIHMEASLIAELAPALRRSPVPVVVDHMGRLDASLGLEQSAFKSLLALLNDKNIWVKVSGLDRVTRQARPMPTRSPSRGSWSPSLATAASGAPTGRIPIIRDQSRTMAFWSIPSRQSCRVTPRGRLFWSITSSVFIVSLRRGL